jgi:MinD superfamily P-loop ATPase
MRIAIASGKGGTGKTTLAVNLAMLAAETEQVLLLDLDVEEPNSSLFIKGELKEETQMGRMVPQWEKQACTLCGKCSQVCRFNAVLKLGDRIMVLPELCHSCYACSELCPAAALPMQKMPLGSLKQYRRDKLTFLESKLEIGVEQTSPLIRQSLDFVDRNLPGCDYQFLDCPPGTSCSMISATKTADYVILVTEPTPFGLHDLGLAVKTMRQLGKPFGVVVNRVGIGNAEVFAYCQREQIEIIGKIANSRELAELYSRGELLYSHSREFYRAMEGILEHLRGLV